MPEATPPHGESPPAATVTASILSWRQGQLRRRDDTLAAEKPLTLWIGQQQLTVTMRTPGHDLDLALGFLWGEGILTDARALPIAEPSPVPSATDGGAALVLHPHPDGPLRLEGRVRAFTTTSACGACGGTSIEALLARAQGVQGGATVTFQTLAGLPATLRAAQAVFEQTGGLHAAGLFDPEGRLLLVREDVGRHNAVDKIVGALLRSGRIPPPDGVLLVSGRLGFEIAQKAAVAGIAVVASVSAPSSLAVEVGERLGLTLIGFLRPGGANVYTHPHRVVDAPTTARSAPSEGRTYEHDVRVG